MVAKIPSITSISFKNISKFIKIIFLKEALWYIISLKKGRLDDPKHIAKDMSFKEHYVTGEYELWIKDDSDLYYIIFLIKQAYKKQE